MKIPSVSWAFFGLAVVMLVGYVLNRGLYIGSEIEFTTLTLNDGNTVPYYKKYCHYLYLNGVQVVWVNSKRDRSEVEQTFCSPLRIAD